MHNRLLLDLLIYFLWGVGDKYPANDAFHPKFNFNTAACNVQLDAGPDQYICEPDIVQLDGTADGDILFTLWTPSTGLSDPNILDPTADVDNKITYTLTGWGIDPNNPNIITNGD